MPILDPAGQDLSNKGQQDTLWDINIGYMVKNVQKIPKNKKKSNNVLYLENEIYAHAQNYIFQIPRVKSFHLSGKYIGLSRYSLVC